MKKVIRCRMSSLVNRALPELKLLAKAKPKLRKTIIKHASPDAMKAISEIVLNMLKGVIKLTPRQKRRLSQYKKEFRLLGKKGVSVIKKRKLLMQKGGGAAGVAASLLIPIALQALSKI